MHHGLQVSAKLQVGTLKCTPLLLQIRAHARNGRIDPKQMNEWIVGVGVLCVVLAPTLSSA